MPQLLETAVDMALRLNRSVFLITFDNKQSILCPFTFDASVHGRIKAWLDGRGIAHAPCQHPAFADFLTAPYDGTLWVDILCDEDDQRYQAIVKEFEGPEHTTRWPEVICQVLSLEVAMRIQERSNNKLQNP
jgi:hypothetical protein